MEPFILAGVASAVGAICGAAAGQVVKGWFKSSPKKPRKDPSEEYFEVEEEERLSAEEARQQRFEKILERVKQHYKGSKCPVCEGCTSAISEIVQVVAYHEGHFVPGSNVTPLVPVMCETCGHTSFLNAIRLGLISRVNGKFID